MTPSDRLLEAIAWIGSVLVVAGIVHIVSTLAMPRLAPNDAYTRIAALTPLDAVTILPSFGPGASPLPFEDPATVVAICRYDLAEGPLRLSGRFGDGLTMISAHSSIGEVFYSMTDHGSTNGALNLLFLTREQKDAIENEEDDDSPAPEPRIVSPTRTGFVMIRALAADPQSMDLAKSRIKAIGCKTDVVADL